MILTVEEFKEMGFDSDDDKLTADCIKRAEFVLSGLSGGKAILAAQTKGAAAEYVKQACAFQASTIMREEAVLRAQKSESEKEDESGAEVEEAVKNEKISIGDFSYSYSTSSSDSSLGSSSGKSSDADYEPLDTNFTVIRLLRAAGCLYTGMEAVE